MTLCYLKSGKLLFYYEKKTWLKRIQFLGFEEGEDYIVNHYLIDGKTTQQIFHTKEYAEFETTDEEILYDLLYGGY